VENASGTRTTHTWNDENQLTQVAKTGMTTNAYTFNGDGQRVQVVDSQGTKKPIWDFQNVLLETDGSNVTQVIYTLEPAGYGNLVSQRRGSTTSFYLFDALGSTRKLTSSAGSVTDSYDFRAYGETFASSGSTVNVFRWVGELGYYLDIDRLAYYLRARTYNPKIARYLSRDPMGFEGSAWNLYEYANSSPCIFIDPDGYKFINGPPCSACLQQWTACEVANLKNYGWCISGGPGADVLGTIGCELFCRWLCTVTGPYGCLTCRIGCVVGGGIKLICDLEICNAAQNAQEHICGGQYNRCTLNHKRDGCTENWRPD
jgi:RHS repeat-associated protein